jgi:hypothetical protein
MPIIFDETNAAYHADPAYSSTEGKLALEDLQKLADHRDGLISRDDEARHFTFGSAAHCLFLEPNAFPSRYAVKPEGMNLSTKEGRAWKADLGGREVITADEMQSMHLMRKRLSPAVRAILDDADGRPEVTFRNEDDGLPMQCRLDWWRKSRHAVHDVKTTTRFSSFVRAAHDCGYAFSAAWYCHVYHRELGVWPTFDFLVLEACAPFRSAVFTPTDAFLAYGRKQVEALLPRLRDAHRRGDFSSDCPDRIDLDVPGFVRAAELVEDAGFLV